MGHCQDCKWWERASDEVRLKAGDVGGCRRVVKPLRDGPFRYPESSETLAFVIQRAHLWTRPEFGCVQYEAKV